MSPRNVSKWIVAASLSAAPVFGPALEGAALAKKDAAQERASLAADFAKLVQKVDAAKADATKKNEVFGGAKCVGFAEDFLSFGKSRHFAEGYYNGGVLLEQCGDAKRAEQAYQDAIATNPSFAPAHVNLGEIYYKQGITNQAQSEFDAALKADPKSSSTYADQARVQAYNDTALLLFDKAKASGDKKLYDDAVGQLRRALALDASSMPAYNLLALIEFTIAEADRSKLDLAELVCKQAKEVNDKYPPIYNVLGLIKLRKKNVTGALKEFKDAAELDPRYIEAQLNIGAITLSARDYATAEKAFKATLDANPQNPQQKFDATMGMAVALRGQRRADEAEQWYQKAKALDARSCAVPYNLGLLYQDYRTSEDYSHLNKAKAFFNEFLTCGRADGDKLGDAKRRIKDVDDTFKALAEAKKLEEDNKKQMEEMERLQKQQEEQLKKMQEEEQKQKGAAPAANNAAVVPAPTAPAPTAPAPTAPAPTAPAPAAPAKNAPAKGTR